jgi:hypothetical protein
MMLLRCMAGLYKIGWGTMLLVLLRLQVNVVTVAIVGALACRVV